MLKKTYLNSLLSQLVFGFEELRKYLVDVRLTVVSNYNLGINNISNRPGFLYEWISQRNILISRRIFKFKCVFCFLAIFASCPHKISILSKIDKIMLVYYKMLLNCSSYFSKIEKMLFEARFFHRSLKIKKIVGL